MTKQLGGNNTKVGGMAPGMGPGMAPGGMMGGPGGMMGGPGGMMGLAGLANQSPYQANMMTGNQFDQLNHGAMNGLGSMLGGQPRFHVLPELAQELSSMLYHQNGLAGLGNAMMPYQNTGYGSMFAPTGGMGQYGLFGGKNKKSKTRRKPLHKKTKKHKKSKKHKKRKTKYNHN